MKHFLSGAITLGYFVITLFFVRFWKKVHDQLFLFFAMAFGILGLERLIFFCVDPSNEIVPYLYIQRLFAFVLILYAIIDKNKSKKFSPK